MKAVEKYLGAYQNAVGDYEKDHPHWRIEVLVSLIKWGLTSLKHYVEDPDERKITWNNPFVELHYAVDWNWKSRGVGDIAPGGHVFGKLTKRNTATKEIAVKTLSEIMARQFNAMALADATNWAWYEKLKNYYTPVLPLELSAELRAIKNKRVRRKAFDQLVRPFAIGGAYIDYGSMELKDRARVPKRVAKQLANIGKLMDIPRIGFDGRVNGRKFELSLVFLIHALIADYDKRKAYHPITLGLAFLPEVDGVEITKAAPAKWSRKDQQRFWEGLLREVEKIATLLIPEAEADESVILSVNSQLKVPASWWHPENRSGTIKQITDAHAQTGELLSFSVEATGNSVAQIKQAACPVCGWAHDAGFTQIKMDGREVISLRGVLPEIVRLVHAGHEKGLNGLSTKDEALQKACGGYLHPCKAFDDLNRRDEYKQLFDTGKRGFISLRGAVGRNRNKSESSSE